MSARVTVVDFFIRFHFLPKEVKSSPPQTRMSFPAKSFIAGFFIYQEQKPGVCMQSTRLTFAQDSRTSERSLPQLIESPATARSSLSGFAPARPIEKTRIPFQTGWALHTGTTLQPAEYPVIQADEDSFSSRYRACFQALPATGHPLYPNPGVE